MMIGRVGETAFGHMLAPFAAVATSRTKGLPAQLIDQWLVIVTDESPSSFALGALGSQRTFGTESLLLNPINHMLPLRTILKSSQVLPGGTSKTIPLRLIGKSLRRKVASLDQMRSRRGQVRTQALFMAVTVIINRAIMLISAEGYCRALKLSVL